MTDFAFKKEIPPDSDDSQASDEAIFIADGRDLEREAAESGHERSEYFKDFFKEAASYLIGLVIIFIVCIVMVWALHLLTPKAWHWLESDQIEKLQTIIFAFAAASGFQGFAKKHSS